MTTGDEGDARAGANGATNGASKHVGPDQESDDDAARAVAADLPPETDLGRKLLDAPPPPSIADLAEACVRFVERSVGVRLDYTPETLPLLDHYLEGARAIFKENRESAAGGLTLEIVAQSVGAYLGEVVRRRYASWWKLEDRPEEHRLEFHHLFLTIHPVALALDALTLEMEEDAGMALVSSFDLDADDRDAAMMRLADLPPTTIEEFVTPSMRVEVLDIVVDAVRATQGASDQSILELEPEDYVEER